jgi:protein TonB
MNTQHSPYHFPQRESSSWAANLFKHGWPFVIIIVLHLGFFYALQSGLLHQAPQTTTPKEISATLIVPEMPKPEQPAPPQPALPTAPPKPPQPATKTSPKPLVPVKNPVPPQTFAATPVAPVAAPADAVQSATPVASIAPPAPVQPRVVTSGIEYLRQPQADYPPLSRRMGEEGEVMLRILINEKGLPERVDIQKSSGYARLDEAARQAGFRAAFKPYVENGKIISVYVTQPIKFRLDN